MKKILISLSMIGAVAAVIVGGTTAFFSDTETSSGNTFTAGAIDLTIDNESYYNGVASPSTTWALANLDDGNGPGPNGQYLFFNFNDLKPGDEGEDTISVHVDTNPAWACVDIDLTADDDVDCNDPEYDDDPTCENEPNVDPLFDGELGDELNFVFWADDGDNVLENDETVLTQGPASSVLGGVTWALADSTGNIFEGDGPLQPDTTYYIGKAWCFGDLTLAPLTQDGENDLIDPTVATGIECDGSAVTNASQTDLLQGDISFTAIQTRHNENYVCGRDEVPEEPEVITADVADGWSTEATGTLNQDRWLAKARHGDNNPTAGAYELEVGFGPGLRDEENHGWSDNVGETFTLSYDDTTKIATLTVGSDTATYTVTGTPSSIGITAKGAAGYGVTKFESATLDGVAIPDLVATTGGHKNVSISGPEVEGDFVLTGTVTLDWITPVDEGPALQVDVLYTI